MSPQRIPVLSVLVCVSHTLFVCVVQLPHGLIRVGVLFDPLVLIFGNLVLTYWQM